MPRRVPRRLAPQPPSARKTHQAQGESHPVRPPTAHARRNLRLGGAGRREDRLVFDLQTAVAESFGYCSQAPDGTLLPVRASEALMKRYYWAAKAVAQLNQILLLNIEERLNPSTHAPRRINDRFNDKAGMILPSMARTS